MYVTFFGLMMTCLECNLGNLAPKFKANFGFMFSFIGRTVFILFCSTLCFAMGGALGYIAGAATARECARARSRGRRSGGRQRQSAFSRAALTSPPPPPPAICCCAAQ